ncbi:MAG: universal stress protein [Chitinophagales bacterium]
MRTIIAATDFSPVSYNAAYYAADLAAAMNAELSLINIVQLPVTISEIPISGYAFDEMIEDSEEELKKLRDKLAEHVKNKIKIDTKIPIGSVPGLLQEEAREKKAFAIVLGTDKTTAIEHLFTENHALAAIHGISTPVLIVPEQTSYKNIRKIVLAADLREPGKITPLQFLKDWIKLFNAKLDIVNVVKKFQNKPEYAAGTIALQNELEQFNPEFHFIYEDKVTEAIDEYIEQNHPDLLVTIPAKYGFFARLFHKSKSKQLIRHPRVPVLSILE